MKPFILIAAVFGIVTCYAQTKLVLTGQVFDSKTKEPLALATVEVKGRSEQTLTDSRGRYEFKVPKEYFNDSLYVSYLGYKPKGTKVSTHQSEELFFLEEYATVLNELVITSTKINLRDIDKSMVVVKGNIYAQQHEVTNKEFAAFLNNLEETNQMESLKNNGFDLSGYDKSTRAFFERYQTPAKIRRGKSKDELSSGDFPAVNISYESAVAYCDWLTDQYNSNSKRKKFKKVKFRLPNLNEWQISAIGYTRFQSWTPEENMVDIYIPDDTMTMASGHGRKETVKLTTEMYYPWSRTFHYKMKPMNHLGCFLGNFRVDMVAKPCPVNPPAFDGFVMMAPVECYFPNDMGLYDVVGNVAEMVSEKGKACGGSWNDVPAESTVFSVKSYARPESTVGFRVFMEVLE